MTRSSPPQRGQSVMSISNTRFRRCAQVSGAVGGSLQSALVIAEVEGCAAALDLLDGLDGDARLQEYQPIGPRVRSCLRKAVRAKRRIMLTTSRLVSSAILRCDVFCSNDAISDSRADAVGGRTGPPSVNSVSGEFR